MSDDADAAALHMEQLEELRRRFIPKGGPEANGACHNCEAPLADGIRFCDAACRDDYERRLKASL